MSLLLLALKQVPEAVAQFETHVRLFRCVGVGGWVVVLVGGAFKVLCWPR